MRRNRRARARSSVCGHLGVLQQQRLQRGVPEADQPAVAHRGGGRGAGAGVEQAQLAEHLARAEHRQQVLPAVAAGAAELDLALDDDVEPVALVALGEEHLAASRGCTSTMARRREADASSSRAANSGALRTMSSSTSLSFALWSGGAARAGRSCPRPTRREAERGHGRGSRPGSRRGLAV